MPPRTEPDSAVADAPPASLGLAGTFARLLAPLVALILLAAALYLRFDGERAVVELTGQRQVQVAVGRQTLRTYLDRPLHILHALAERQPDVRAELDDLQGKRTSAITAGFTSLLIRGPDLHMARWIGEDGREIVRVETDDSGLPHTVGAAELQQKGSRPYVREALAAPRGSYVLSPLELSQEHGRVRQPYLPTLRLAARVHSSQGVPRGIFLLNLRGQQIIDRFAQATADAGTGVVMLVDDKGMFLRSGQPGISAGEQLHRQVSFAATHPVPWAWIAGRPAGQVETDSGLWVWRSIDLLPAEVLHTGNTHWIVVSRIDPATLAAARHRGLPGVALAALAGLLAGAVVAWWLALSIERRRDSERRLLQALDLAREREQEHDELLQFMNMVTDNVPGHLAYWNREHRLVFANRPFSDWFGRGRVLEGLTRDEVKGMAQSRRHASQTGAALDGQVQHFDINFQHDDGTPGFAMVSYIPDRGDNGEVRGFLEVRRDITELKSAQIHLSELNGKLLLESTRAQAASVAKTEFLSNMSHEMRSPLNAMLGLCHLAERDAPTPRMRDKLRKIRVAGGSLLALINDILDLAKIEAGRMELEAAPFRLGDVLDTLRTLMNEAVGTKPLEVAIVTAPDGPDCLMGDALRLSQVLINLAGNAVKFTPRGSVTVHVTPLEIPLEDQDGRVRLRFVVTDTGIGIAADKLEEIFQPFSQVDTSTTRQYGGTGLGLAICRRLVRLMGGQLRATSVPRHGSEFWFDLDFATCAPELVTAPVRAPASGGLAPEANPSVEEAAAEHQLQGLRVLVVDDSDINLEVTAGILQAAGAEVVTAENGAVALQLLSAQARQFDVVLMDIQMPVMDGYTATRHIRANAALAGLPVVALSAGAFSEQRARALEAGVDAFITKPVEVRPLLETVLRMARRVAPGLSTGVPPPRSAASLSAPMALPAASAPAGAANASPGSGKNVPEGAPSVLDAERARRVWRTEAVYRGYLRAFVGRYARAAETLAAADATQRASLAHKLRGAAAQLGLDEVASCATAIEASVASADADHSVALLGQAMARAVDAIAAYAGERSAPAEVPVPAEVEA